MKHTIESTSTMMFNSAIRIARFAAAALLLAVLPSSGADKPLRAGIAKVDITDRAAGPVNDPLFAKALVVKCDAATVVLIAIDAVAIGEIGRIKNDFLANVRAQLQKELGIALSSVVINASHCHGVVRADTGQLTVQAVKAAWQAMVPVKVGAGTAQEARISADQRESAVEVEGRQRSGHAPRLLAASR